MKTPLIAAIVACSAALSSASASVTLDVQPDVAVQASDTITMAAAGLTAGHTVLGFFSAATGSSDFGIVQLGLDAPIAFLVLGSSDVNGEFTAQQNFPTIPVELQGLTFYMQVVDVVDANDLTLAASNVDSFTFGS